MRAGVDHGMCFLLELGKVRKVCIIDAKNVFFGRCVEKDERRLLPSASGHHSVMLMK